MIGLIDSQRNLNAANMINYIKTVLKKKLNQTTFESAFMARYLLHIVGDLHQPLHGTNMYNK